VIRQTGFQLALQVLKSAKPGISGKSVPGNAGSVDQPIETGLYIMAL